MGVGVAQKAAAANESGQLTVQPGEAAVERAEAGVGVEAGAGAGAVATGKAIKNRGRSIILDDARWYDVISTVATRTHKTLRVLVGRSLFCCCTVP